MWRGEEGGENGDDDDDGRAEEALPFEICTSTTKGHHHRNKH